MTKAKKILALVMAVVMCLSVMVGTLSVSAATPGTITVGTTTVDEGAASATVTVTIAGAAFSAGEIKMTYDSKLPVPTVVSALQITADTETAGKVNVVVESGASTAGNVDSGSFTLTFAGIEALTAGDYAITVDSSEFGDYNENDVLFNAVAGKIAVVAKPTHTCEYTKTITKQPTRTEKGVMTYTCECGDSYTEAIAIPTKLTDKAFSSQLLYLDTTVGTRISVKSGATGGVIPNGYTDYIIEIKYQYYGSGYKLDTDTITKTSAERDGASSSGKTHYFYFTKLALYEMSLAYDVVIYALDANGVVVAYTEEISSLADQAFVYAQTYAVGNDTLMRCLVDMVNFGSKTQEFFAASNPGSDIDGAPLANAKFDQYQSKGSTEADMPESFNTTSLYTPIDETYEILNVTGTMQIGASNKPYISVRATNYDPSQLKAVCHYTNAYNTPVEQTVMLENANEITTNNAGNKFYKFAFDKLALYDLQSVVSVDVYYGDKLEGTFEYSLGNFIKTYYDVASMKPVLQAAVLFGQSARAQLV